MLLTLGSHIAHWAEAGVPLTVELRGGTEDPCANMVDIPDATITAPARRGPAHPRPMGTGYFAADIAKACLARGVSFVIGAKRTRPLMIAA
ncbi:hypothetical protein GCM10022240_29820 [Microbacterium kribbense]|uniref:Thiamine pyrophosphate enzyme N-terminal TPP-binding domain-containing protein n=1 Tax=Microbacterium kribbense TaxID=433645 RepID=A0ABP7GVN2_9MICO